MRRKLLLIEPNLEDQKWLTSNLAERFKYLSVTCVQTQVEAHQEMMNQAFDFVVTDLLSGEDSRHSAIVHDLIEIAPMTPVLVLTEMRVMGEYMLDVISVGVRHILYKEDVRQDIAKLVAAIIETVHDLARRDTLRDTFGERMHAISHKVHDVDKRIVQMEKSLEGIVQSINAMVQVIEKRGGLEDRVKEIEDNKAAAIKIGLWAAGVIGALLSAGVAAVFRHLKW
jgi:ActR/RegA family two-component response regulator